jgi:hypothetical protein
MQGNARISKCVFVDWSQPSRGTNRNGVKHFVSVRSPSPCVFRAFRDYSEVDVPPSQAAVGSTPKNPALGLATQPAMEDAAECSDLQHLKNAIGPP